MMWSFILKWFPKKNNNESEIVEDEWYSIYFYGYEVDDFWPVSNAINIFMRENFQIGDYREIRKQRGFFDTVVGFKFKNTEDAMAFKLRWL